ncbi:MAG TPA: hypothetical protein VKR58_13250, partial [Aquella sp.]|nr:hypothetical protein [Aquella sp.]
MPKEFLIVKDLLLLFRRSTSQLNPREFIATNIIKGKQNDPSLFSNWEQALEKIHEDEGILEVNFDETVQDKWDIQALMAAMTRLHLIRNEIVIEVLAEDLSDSQHEKKHLENLGEDFNQNLFLSEPFLLYLERLSSELRYLLFIDFRLFYHCYESWKDYESRERDCVQDLFNGAEMVCDVVRQTPHLTIDLDYVKKLHKTLSLSRANKRLGHIIDPGNFRSDYKTFGLNFDNTTKEGITELLQRIQQDDNAEGFMLGELKPMGIMLKFYEKMAQYAKNKNTSPIIKEEFERTKAVISQEIFNELKLEFPLLTENNVKDLINKELE